ncbi:uncharacterized protein MELLADRAFT_110516 [Melampsora larici-populina 98AG31]|uniref:SAP domain-containing protein n=1 Tax=Melampsora larici-populina (strain 98AG31 / pathotype 3-4-7) TaxID=747676 RepID=F4S032_MELLP|nr:uncharacterized protein MELLADRAFT_110516 [Melampsora larici-populina 98AG31]EGG02011.1 hypothetical protein MELLADRAFT_110516 [Melampsora larici-populina 98AG31]
MQVVNEVESLKKLKLLHLKSLCRDKNLAISGTKAVLIGRLTGLPPEKASSTKSKKKVTSTKTGEGQVETDCIGQASGDALINTPSNTSQAPGESVLTESSNHEQLGIYHDFEQPEKNVQPVDDQRSPPRSHEDRGEVSPVTEESTARPWWLDLQLVSNVTSYYGRSGKLTHQLSIQPHGTGYTQAVEPNAVNSYTASHSFFARDEDQITPNLLAREYEPVGQPHSSLIKATPILDMTLTRKLGGNCLSSPYEPAPYDEERREVSTVTEQGEARPERSGGQLPSTARHYQRVAPTSPNLSHAIAPTMVFAQGQDRALGHMLAQDYDPRGLLEIPSRVEPTPIQDITCKRKFIEKPFVTPFKKISKPNCNTIQKPCLENLLTCDSIDLHVNWYNRIFDKLLDRLESPEEDKQDLKRLGMITKAQLIEISVGDEKIQAISCLRFLIARLYNKLSTMEEEGSSLFSVLSLPSVIKVEEVTKGISCGMLTSKETVYFISYTGELLGSDSQLVSDPKRNIRSDWEEFIKSRSIDDINECKDLLELVRTSDFDTYPHGISRHFISGCNDSELLEHAKTYVLANLAPNSTSGEWKSIFDCFAEFNSIHKSMPTTKTSTSTSLSLFLPASHYVEKVYRKTELDKLLHEAICSIQTSNRTHLCLKLTGQIIGNDQEGVVILWQELLGCDVEGVKRLM